MTKTLSERVAIMEERSTNRDQDIADIKASIKALEDIALKGKGALGTALFIGGIIGWFVGIGISLYALFRH